jgi:integrase
MQRPRAFKQQGKRGWQVQWWVRDPAAARGWRRRQKGGFHTRRAAEDWVAVELGHQQSAVSLGELRDRYLAVHPGAESTKRELRRRLGLAFGDAGPWDERMNPARLTGEEIEAWRLTISDGQRFYVTQALKQTLRWGFERGLIPQNAAANVKNPMPTSREKMPFESWDEVEAVAEELGASDGHMVIVMAGTGVRPGEAAVLDRRRDLDLKADVPAMLVRRRRTKDGQIVATTKDGKPRRVPLTPRVREAIAAIPARIDTPLLFPGKRGRYLDFKSFSRHGWKDALDTAKLEHRGVYALRHTFATFAIAADVDTFTLSRLMGTSVENIDATYGHLLHGHDEAVLGKLAGFDGCYMAADAEAAEA